MKNLAAPSFIIVIIILSLFSYYAKDYVILCGDDRLSYLIKFRKSIPTDKFAIEIRNASSRNINFKFGFNDMLFPDKLSVIQYIKQGDVVSGLSPLVGEQYIKNLKNTYEEDYFRGFLFLLKRTFHHVDLTDRYEPFSCAWAKSPMLIINSFGFGACGTYTGVLCKIWQELGYKTRERNLNGHAVSEVFDGSRWILLDADKSAYYFDDDLKLVGIDELKRNPSLICPDMRLVIYRRPEYEFPQSDATGSVKDIIVKSEGHWLDSTETLPSETDWIPLNVTLPPWATFSFPFQGEDVFFAELIDLVPRYGERVLTPKHKYAVLELDKGTVGKISVGLYPFKVEGDCILRIDGQDKQIKGSEFDQVNKYRYERTFARTITLVEAKSTVRIYYLLNNYIHLLESNILIFKENRAKELEVTLFRKKDRKTHLKKKEKKQFREKNKGFTEVIPKSVFASSVSYNRTELARFLIDGKVGTSWISDLETTMQPIEIVFDLGEPYLIAKIEWLGNFQNPSVTPSEFTIYFNQDGKKYEEICRKNDTNNKKMIWHKIEMVPHLARYVKIAVMPMPHSNAGYFQAALAEVKFFVKRYDQN